MSERWPSRVNGIAVPYGRTLAELRALLASEGQQWAAMIAIGRSSEPEALDLLSELASARDAHVRRLAIEVIGLRHDGRLLQRVVLERMRDGHGAVVRTAATVAASLGLTAARQDLRGLLADPTAATREVAVRSLAQRWRQDDFDDVVATFRADPSTDVKKAAAWTLRVTVSEPVSKILIELWASDPLPRHRRWACEIAEQYPHPRYRDMVARLKHDDDGHVRRAAGRACETIDDAVQQGDEADRR